MFENTWNVLRMHKNHSGLAAKAMGNLGKIIIHIVILHIEWKIAILLF